MHDYQKACDEAADAQGITAIRDELKRRGIVSEVWQTGGFCMVCAVPLVRAARGVATRYIACTAEGAGVVTEDEEGCLVDAGPHIIGEGVASVAPAAIADAVAAWLRDHQRPAINAVKMQSGILTVAALREILRGVDDGAHVIIEDGPRFLNIKAASVPNGDETFTVTLFAADTFDPRQL